MIRRINKKGLILIFLGLFFIIWFLGVFLCYAVGLKPVSKSSDSVLFSVSSGDTLYSISSKLEEAGLIKSKFSYKVYLKIHGVNNLKSGKFMLDKNMGIKKIVSMLSSDDYSTDTISITFKEGINIDSIASIISEKTSNSIDDVYNLLKDENYLNSVINDYWFIDDSIKNSNIYYALEGYLFPDTYEFYPGAGVTDIFKAMLDEMGKKLEPYRDYINNSSLSVHELLTLASIVELESGRSHECNMIASVFYNRINAGMTLGSDVTTYYASRKSFKDDLTYNELNECNSYNTRGTCFTGLPVGPIASPSMESIDGVMKPNVSEYYYFVADKDGNTYFSSNSYEHNNTILRLKREGLWYVYE